MFLPVHHRLVLGHRANVVAGIDVVDHREAALAVLDVIGDRGERGRLLAGGDDLHAVGLARDHFSAPGVEGP